MHLLFLLSLILFTVHSACAEESRLEKGQKIYDYFCYQCHGYAGDARTLAARYLTPPPRDFTTSSPGILSEKMMIDAITNGKSGSGMVSFSNVISSDEIRSVVVFIREKFMTDNPAKRLYHSAENGWPDHERYSEAFPFVTGEMKTDTSDVNLSSKQRHGKQVFLTACISCHDRSYQQEEPLTWEVRAVSYPRPDTLPHLEEKPVLDSMTGATPFAEHDKLPVITSLSSEEKSGQVIYMKNCAFCHAADGTGKNWIGSFMQPPARDLTRSTLISSGSNQNVISVIQSGLPGTSMPAWKDVLSEQQLIQLVAYVKRAYGRTDKSTAEKNMLPAQSIQPVLQWKSLTNPGIDTPTAINHRQ